MNENKDATEASWVDSDDASELTDEFFRQAEEFDGSRLVHSGAGQEGRAVPEQKTPH